MFLWLGLAICVSRLLQNASVSHNVNDEDRYVQLNSDKEP